MAHETIYDNRELRLKGWKAALRSPRTPRWLKPSLRQNIRRLERELRRRKTAS